MKIKTLISLVAAFFSSLYLASANPDSQPGTYKMVVEGFDWGPAVNKIILSLPDTTSKVNAADFSVFVQRKLDGTNIPAEQSSGKREVISAYISNETGDRIKTGRNITLVLSVGPSLPIASPFQYIRVKGNVWVDYNLTIIQTKTQQIWNKSTGKIMPIIDEFDLSKKFNYQDKTMSYATYSPKNKKDKAPLIIWLHGGGEGGTDPTVPLLGNKAANYAGAEIQTIFDGAYVLVPQCPGAWMHNAQGVGTQGKENDVYNEGLMALIKNYVSANPGIDPTRIYVGGCSNGGYMALKLILLYPDYFAAGYISALAYRSQYITDADIQKSKTFPCVRAFQRRWHDHSRSNRRSRLRPT